MIDWKQISKPQADVISDIRSCRNCAHRDSMMPYECHRTGMFCARSVQSGPCGMDLKYWSLRRSWLRRMFTW